MVSTRSKDSAASDNSKATSGGTHRRISSWTDSAGNTYCRREFIYVDMGKRCHPYSIAQITQFKDYPTGLYAYITWYLRKRDVPITALTDAETERASETTEQPHLVVKLNSPSIKCRELFQSDKRDSVPVKMIVGKCLVINYKNVSEVLAFIPEPNHFWVVHSYDSNNRRLCSFKNKVNVGPLYQAQIPEVGHVDPVVYDEEREDVDDTPLFCGQDCSLTEEEIDHYLEMARMVILINQNVKSEQKRSLIHHGDESINLALATLTQCKYDPDYALEKLLDGNAVKPRSLGRCFSLTAKFFNDADTDKFQKGYKFALNNPGNIPFFHTIKRDYLPHKRIAELVQFYYYWKRTEEGDSFRYLCKQTLAERSLVKSKSSVRLATERVRQALASSYKADDPPRVCTICQYGETDKQPSEWVSEAAVGTALNLYLKTLGHSIPDNTKTKRGIALICNRCYISFRKYDDFKCHDEPPRPGELQVATLASNEQNHETSNGQHLAGEETVTTESKNLSDRATISETTPPTSSLGPDCSNAKQISKELYGGKFIQILDGGSTTFCSRTDVIFNQEFHKNKIQSSQQGVTIVDEPCEPPQKRGRTERFRADSSVGSGNGACSSTIQSVGNSSSIQQLTSSMNPYSFHQQIAAAAAAVNSSHLDYPKCAQIADFLACRAFAGGNVTAQQLLQQASVGPIQTTPTLTPQQAASAMYYLKMAQSQQGNLPTSGIHGPGMLMMGGPMHPPPQQQSGQSQHPGHNQMMDTPALRHLSEIAAAGRLGMLNQQGQQRPNFLPPFMGPPQQDLSRLSGPYNMFPPHPQPPPSAPPSQAPSQSYDPMSMLAAAAASGRIPTPMIRPSSTHNHAHVHAHSHTHLHLNDNPTAVPPPGAFDAAALMRERDALMRLAIMAPTQSMVNSADHSAAIALAHQAASAFRNPSQIEESSNNNPLLTSLFAGNNSGGLPRNLRGSGLALPPPPPSGQNRPSSDEPAGRR
ncbi:hypothetical protein ACOME3_003916 [Neoechinorhynchus agilis]